MIRFYNGKTLENGALTDNEVWVDGSRIAYVGPAKTEMPPFERQINLSGNLLMPGFKNTHTHSAMTFLRSLADDQPLQQWLFESVFPREARLSGEAVYAFTKLAFLEYIANGITSCFDMYFYPDDFIRAATDMGFRAVICESFTAGNDVSVAPERFEKYNRIHPLISYRLGFHAEYTGTEEMLQKISEISHQLRQPVWSHNSETASEVQDCIDRHGMTPTAYFDSLGLYDYGGGGFHCVYFTDEDLQIFKKRGCTAVLNAGSNAKLASGIAPFKRFVDSGVNLAIGTDGPASNNALDFFREMHLINVLAKLQEQNAAAGDPSLVLQAAVAQGARAVGLTDCDDIAPGKQADMIVIDMNRPNMRPVHNILKNLIYSGNPSNVKMTMIAGKILYENGEFFVGEPVKTIYSRAERLAYAITTE